jgi:diguanylate cyclase (GGDEF)-like protein/PAS domain S-box-containing protein
MQSEGILPTERAEQPAALDEQSRLLLSLAGSRIISESTELLAGEVDFLRSILEHLPAQIFVKDTHSRFIFANSATLAAIGVKTLEDVRGKTDFAFYTAQNATVFFEREQGIMASGVAQMDFEEKYIGPDGLPSWHLSSKIPLTNERGEPSGLVGISLDITERKRQETLRNGQSDLLEMIARSEPLPDVLESLLLLIESQLAGIYGSILLLDAEGRRLYKGAAPNLPDAYNAQIDGVEIGNFVGSCGTAAWRREPVIVSDIMTDPHWADFRGLAAAFGFRSCWSTPILAQQSMVLGTFALYSFEIRSPTDDEKKLIDLATHIAGIAIERKQAEDRIHYLAHHDTLTGLPNRAAFRDLLSDAVTQARQADATVTVVYLDIDNFKSINDSLGHGAGDELLSHFAARLRNFAAPGHHVVRLGGDEFVMICPGDRGAERGFANRIARLRDEIAAPMVVEGHEIRVTSSIGAASFPRDGSTPEAVLAAADAAMYRSKQLGKDRLSLASEPEAA